MKSEEVVQFLQSLKDEERKAFIDRLLDAYCEHCGSDAGRRCFCMNDE